MERKFLTASFLTFAIFAMLFGFVTCASAQDIVVTPPAQEIPVEPEISAPNLTYNEGLAGLWGVRPDYSFEDETRDLNRPNYRPNPRRRNIIDEFSGCILTPIPIDDRFVGCKINFDPEPAIDPDFAPRNND